MATRGKKQQISTDGTVLTVKYPTIRKELVVDAAMFDADLQHEFMMHGLKQRYGDLESGGTPAEKYAAAQRLRDANLAGSWEVSGERDTSGIVIEAVARMKGLKQEQVEAALNEAEDREEKLREWRGNLKVKAMIATIRAERATEAAEEAEGDDDIEIDVE
jgi:hypothetical protein